jgi:hypothetical protein
MWAVRREFPRNSHEDQQVDVATHPGRVAGTGTDEDEADDVGLTLGPGPGSVDQAVRFAAPAFHACHRSSAPSLPSSLSIRAL